MTHLQWSDAPEQSDPRTRSASSASTNNPPAVSASNPWFAVAMALAGVIVGYVIGNFQ